MRRALSVLLAALVAVPFALAARIDPGSLRRPHVPLQWEQSRALHLLQRRGAVVHCGGSRSNAVALTFDDGPSPYTAALLDALRSGDAHATFFLVGNRVGYWPQQVLDERTMGAIGNHTWTHPRLTDLPPWLVFLELVRTEFDVHGITGTKPKLFRAPYAQHDATVDATAHRLGMLEVLWSVDARDWAPGANRRKVVRNVVAGLRPGAIVLLHDIHPWTVAAVPEILRAIRLRGLRAVSVPELLALDPPSANQHCPVPPSAP